MTIVGWVASIVTGIALLVAGASKLAAGPSWPAQARDLGAPAIAIPVVPWVEIVVGALAAVRLAHPLPAIAAVGLLVAFTALIMERLREGNRPVCACFGAWAATPIGAGHVVRNVALISVALAAALN